MTNAHRASVVTLVVGALALTVATIRHDDAGWIEPLLWALWPVWIVEAAVTTWVLRRHTQK